jgi:hypothetical protein
MDRVSTSSPNPRPSTPADHTPSAHPPLTQNTTVHAQHNTLIPSTPGGDDTRVSLNSLSPGAGSLTCSAISSAFSHVTARTAKCSECDMRNKETMLRCPGCTFQVCKLCQDRREARGRSLAHGNMLSPQKSTPGSGPGSVVRRRPVATVRSAERETGQKNEEEGKGKQDWKTGEGFEKIRKRKREPELKVKGRLRARDTTPTAESSDEDFEPDPASPTSNKRRRTSLISKVDGMTDLPSPFLTPAEKKGDPAPPNPHDAKPPAKAFRDMTMKELLAHHGVDTPENPYQEHFLGRHYQVASNPVIQVPAIVKRGFKPRPTAEEIQKNIQDKVREKLGLPIRTEGAGSNV